MDITEDDFLEHFGVKGMRWGIRKEETSNISSSTETKKTNLSQLEKDVLKTVEKDGLTEERMRRLYGPKDKNQDGPEAPRLTEQQKQALKKAVVVVGAAGALYALNHYGTKALIKRQLGSAGESANMVSFWTDHLSGAHRKPFDPSRSISKLSDEAVHLKAGSILKRISTDQELSIKPNGFYASYKDVDVERYKAAMPIYWKIWNSEGTPATSGYIVNLRAKQDIKAPSPKETYELFKGFLETKDSLNPQRTWAEKFSWGMEGRHITNDKIAKSAWYSFANLWSNDHEPSVKQFFEYIQSKGYNALIDINDAGSLGDSPLRIINSSIFEHAGADVLTEKAIKAAQKSVTRLSHMLFIYQNSELEMDNNPYYEDDFLEHYGVKGMQWGIRKKSPSTRTGGFVGGTAGIAAAKFVFGNTMNVPLAVAVGATTGFVAMRKTNQLLDKSADKKLSEIQKILDEK